MSQTTVIEWTVLPAILAYSTVIAVPVLYVELDEN
jgi:hypothetical protein